MGKPKSSLEIICLSNFCQKTLTTELNAYWRTGDMKSTLLEVEIDRVSGQIIGVSLILPGKVRRDFPELDSANLPKTDGYPIVDLSEWLDNRIKDDPGALHVFIDSSRLLITLTTSLAATKTISADGATFGVDRNNSIV